MAERRVGRGLPRRVSKRTRMNPLAMCPRPGEATGRPGSGERLAGEASEDARKASGSTYSALVFRTSRAPAVYESFSNINAVHKKPLVIAGRAGLYGTSREAAASPRRWLLYHALARDGVDGWTLERFETATGLSLLTPDGAVHEDLPPMSRFLNRLLALPIDDQNALFAALEVRIAAKVAETVEGGVYEQGVETVRADSLTLASREAVFVHDASGAATELCAVVRRDRLHPLAAEEALRMRDEARAAGCSARLMANPRSGRAALVVPAPTRMLDNGGVEERVRLVRPALRDTMAGEALAASNWQEAGPSH